MGAVTTSTDVFEAAVPFDKRRNGMILGAGALGLVIEKEEDVGKRGMNGICRILGTHSFNTAGHQAKIDRDIFCIELDRFMTKMENEYHIERKSIAPKTVYYSHETFSPREGGCAQTEKTALHKTFGEKYRDIKVINTKGMTGHTMAASIEEAIAAKALQYQKIPPVVNYREPDTDLEGLNLSRGGSHSFEYVIRMVTAYGGQGSYHLLQKVASGGDRFFDRKLYEKWLCRITESKEAKLTNYGRILVAEGSEVPTEKPCCGAQREFEASVTVKNTQSTNTQDANTQDPDMLDEILGIFSEVTKYPKEMLDLTMEIEADLGIDTVKQATILSVISERYGILQEESLKMSDYPTIGHILNMVQEKTLSKKEIAESTAAYQNLTDEIKTVEAAGNETRDKKAEKKDGDASFKAYVDMAVKNNAADNLEEEVFKIVYKITKYPVEMLEKDMELEADLGIDNIGYRELLSLLNERFNIPKYGDAIFRKVSTIGEIIDYIKKINYDSQNKACERCRTKDETNCILKNSKRIDENIVKRDLCLQIPVFVEEKIDKEDLDLKNCKIWVIGDDKQSVRNVSACFKNDGLHVEEFIFDSYSEREDLKKGICDFVSKKVDVIVDCTHIASRVEFDAIDRRKQERLLFLSSEARFIFYKELSERLNEPKVRIVCAISMDGCHGYSNRDQISIDPFYGALSGFYKGLRKEWSKSVVKVVDLGMNKGGMPEDDILMILYDEVESSSKDYEIGYVDGKRFVSRVDYLDRINLRAMEVMGNTHFLITGGGHGITSEITRGLSKRFKAKFTIIGRTVIPDDIEELSKLDKTQSDKVKQGIIRRLEEDHKRVTPTMVEGELKMLENSISIKRLIEDIESDGNEVLYMPCDVRCHEDMKKVLEHAVEKNGPVNIIIHGAGIEKSRLLHQKGREEFKNIFSVKAEGICNLYRLVDMKELKAVLAFSSISGRFGNEAQIDYCSANSFLNSFISMIKAKHKHIYALSISWSGWKDVGIAWRNEFIKNHSEEMGLNLIEPSRGTAEFINILTGGLETSEVIVSRGLSQFTNKKMAHKSFNDKTMIDWVTVRDGGIERAFRVFSPKRDAIIDHHRLGPISLGPAVAYMEMGAELHTIMFGESKQYCFRNIRIDKPLKFFRDEPKEVVAQLYEGREKNSFDMETYTYFEHNYENYGLISLSSMNVSSNLGEYRHLLAIKEIESEHMEEGYTRESLQKFSSKNKNTIQLGTLFIDEKRDNNVFKRNNNGAIISMVLPEGEKTNKRYNLDKLLINPAFMDSVFQVCGIHSQIDTDEVYLPWEVEEFGVIKAPKEIMHYRVYSKLKYISGDTKVYDVIMLNEENEVCYYAKSVKMRVIHS